MWFGLLMPFLGTAVGACAALGIPMGSRRWNSALSGGAAGAMTAACVFNLLLPALDGGRMPALTGFAVGFLALLLPERMPGLCLSPAGTLLLAVVLHNIPEGLAVGAGDSAGLTVGIALQNIPDGAVAAVPLLALGYGRSSAFAAGVLSGAVEPVAAGLMLLFAPYLAPWMGALLGFSAGAMLFVVMWVLAPRMGGSGWGTVCFALGFVLMAG